MDAIIGRYRAHMEESGLILRHISGINFDLTPEEALDLLNFINAYRPTLLALQECETEPRLERVIIDEDKRTNGIRPIKR
jgi:hypothetical protein